MGAEKKPADGGRDKKADGKSSGTAVYVFKVPMHCDGCAMEIKRAVEHMDGVEYVKVDVSANKLTVTGKVDAKKIKAKIEKETKKKVDIVSQPKKDHGGGEKKKIEEKKHKLKKAEPEAPKEKTKKVDKAKELVAVTGTMDVQELMTYLKDKLKTSIDVVPAKKEINIYISGDINIKIGK